MEGSIPSVTLLFQPFPVCLAHVPSSRAAAIQKKLYLFMHMVSILLQGTSCKKQRKKKSPLAILFG